MKNRTLYAGLSLSGIGLVGLSLDAIGQAAHPLTHEHKFDSFLLLTSTATDTVVVAQNTLTGDEIKVVPRDFGAKFSR